MDNWIVTIEFRSTSEEERECIHEYRMYFTDIHINRVRALISKKIYELTVRYEIISVNLFTKVPKEF